ncbi:hypothetical protein JCGZ_05813 [Jatropha curcas]|uniref:JHL10I11.10 protein n=1 Tax=Jatropha curcas TaxID=180498 RepID=E6NU54_JATCU|nr:hypothetical protein JCGZ_05813 [Jatropha curcas]BAJ53164.1 JHL10I11.10 [Jatropha curcas]
MLKINSDGYRYLTNWARSCDACCAAPCTLYCHADSAYLCNNCDEYVHAANSLALKHKRVWVCTACENAPAAFTCQPDAAKLCINCDIEIHSANPLAGRHIRVPITPISGLANTSSTTCLEESQAPLLHTENDAMANKIVHELEEDQTDSWLLLDLDNNDNQTNTGFTYIEDVDQYLNHIKYNSCTNYHCQDQINQQQLSSAHRGDICGDSIVPVQSFEAQDQQEHHHQQQQQETTFIDSGYGASKASFVNTTSNSQKLHFQNQVPLSFTNAGYLLTSSNVPNSYSRFSKRTGDLLPNPSLLVPVQFTPMNREAKVLRYREKRRARKFEKQIRYVTRKANAENRPRVKGRFARKKDMELELDQMFPT